MDDRQEAAFAARGIEKLQRVWTELGEREPFQAVLTSGGQWDEAAFFQTGIEEIRAVIEYARSSGSA